MSMEHFTASLEIKQVSDQRIISGHAAAWALDRVNDVIDRKAFTRTLTEKHPSEIGVFIGHDYAQLPVGVPLKMSLDDTGLYTETKIFEGPVGDNLLAVARGLKEHGQTLGLSIGFRTRASKPERVNGKTVRRLMDVDLMEFSYAARQSIANPAALMTSVKSVNSRKAMSSGSDTGGGYLADGDDDTYHVETRAGRYHVVESDGTSVCDFATEVEANAALTALGGAAKEDMGEEGEPANNDELVNMTAPQAHAMKAVWSTSMVNDLPDSAFLMISPGGQKDSDGKTVPRDLRHLPYKGPDGAVDLPHLRDAIGRIPQMKGVDDAAKARLQARARKMLEDAGSGKSVEESEEWKGGPLTIRALGYALLDLSDTAADEIKAMTLLGESTKDGYRLRAPLRAELERIVTEAKRIADWSATIDKGEDDAAKVAWYRHRLALAGS